MSLHPYVEVKFISGDPENTEKDDNLMMQDPSYVADTLKFPIQVLFIYAEQVKIYVVWHCRERRRSFYCSLVQVDLFNSPAYSCSLLKVKNRINRFVRW